MVWYKTASDSAVTEYTEENKKRESHTYTKQFVLREKKSVTRLPFYPSHSHFNILFSHTYGIERTNEESTN